MDGGARLEGSLVQGIRVTSGTSLAHLAATDSGGSSSLPRLSASWLPASASFTMGDTHRRAAPFSGLAYLSVAS